LFVFGSVHLFVAFAHARKRSWRIWLRQQLPVLKRRHPKPKLGLFDKLFWVAACRLSSAWKQSLIIVMPETSHDRRRILHFSITRHPASTWIVQQLREAFRDQTAPRSSSLTMTESTDWKFLPRFDL
jgi:hypothetical protein